MACRRAAVLRELHRPAGDELDSRNSRRARTVALRSGPSGQHRQAAPEDRMSSRGAAIAGFTLVEALLATALMGVILAAIGTVTAQWLPNWNRGFARVQSSETLAAGLERIVADLAAAEFVTAGAGIRQPVFDGTELSVTFLRT